MPQSLSGFSVRSDWDSSFRKRRSMECAPLPGDGSSVLLVVDDYPENLISMRALLQRDDWHVVTAASGLEALELLLQLEVDLVLLDVMMPGMDGFEVARLMRGNQQIGRAHV